MFSLLQYNCRSICFYFAR